jgi:hypothetical protein
VFLTSTLTLQAQSPVSQKATSGAAQHPTAAHARKSIHHSRHRRRSRAKRAAYRPEFTDHSVQVINGATTQNIVFHDDQKTSELAKGQPAEMKVEVVNGTQKDTQYFRNDEQAAADAAQLDQPVVVGIQSSDTRFAGGNRNPVVTRVASSSPAEAKTASGGGQKVAAKVVPRPKRPAYQADSH